MEANSAHQDDEFTKQCKRFRVEQPSVTTRLIIQTFLDSASRTLGRVASAIDPIDPGVLCREAAKLKHLAMTVGARRLVECCLSLEQSASQVELTGMYGMVKVTSLELSIVIQELSSLLDELGPVTVLIVDDEELLRELMAEILSLEGYKVISAENGREALAALSRIKRQPDLILTDLRMPVMDGVSFCHELRASATCARIPVVVVSGELDLSHQVSQLDLAAVLAKPFNGTDLLNCVLGVLQRVG